MTIDTLSRLVDSLDPRGEPGRLTLIHRFGVQRIGERLPPLLRALRGRPVVWCCDPMHGNGTATRGGVKTRRFDDIRGELELAFDAHAAEGTYLGGVHLELTGENVTECVGGARGLDEAGLADDYRSHVDPRLNYEQALELAMLIARKAARLGAR
jgi:3-deoxy-7-phosphoheptulonate synthase